MFGLTLSETVLALVFLTGFTVLISPPLRRSQTWTPMVTPLASIIGSGFLVSVPLLASRLGIWAVAAIAALCLLAIAVGGAIRYNIRYTEPLLAEGPPPALRWIERSSYVILTAAYFISVAYYLALLGAFLLKIAGIDQPRIGTAIASAIVIGICGTGILRGLRGVEGSEKYTVSANLAAIAALLVVLAMFGAGRPADIWLHPPGLTDHDPWNLLRFLMGLLIVVQGFETSRFMEHLYDRPTRIAAMRRAQIVASLTYLGFFALMIPLFQDFHHATDVAGFIEVIDRVSPWLPWLMALGAVASQFSASVADSIGASGLIENLSSGRLSEQRAYWLIGMAALAVLWLTNVIGLVALASRAFALFYALQCAVAVLVARHNRQHAPMIWFSALAALCLAIAILGIPAGA